MTHILANKGREYKTDAGYSVVIFNYLLLMSTKDTMSKNIILNI